MVSCDPNRTGFVVVSRSDGLVAPDLAGCVLTSTIELDGLSAERGKVLNRRIVAGIPSDYQISFVVPMFAGLLGLPVAWGW